MLSISALLNPVAQSQMSHDRTPSYNPNCSSGSSNPSNRPTLPGVRELFPDLPRSPYNTPDARPRTVPLPAYLPPGQALHPHQPPAYPQHARRPSNPTNVPMPIPQYLAPQGHPYSQTPRPSSSPATPSPATPSPATPSPATPSPATPGSSASSASTSSSTGGHLYQVLAIGPHGLNAVQTETARPIGIYRQDKRRHEVLATPSTDNEPRRFVCQDCGAAFLRPSELRTHQHRHTGQKAYVCTRCGKDFSTSSNLARHTRSLHPDGLAGRLGSSHSRSRASNASSPAASSSASSSPGPDA